MNEGERELSVNERIVILKNLWDGICNDVKQSRVQLKAIGTELYQNLMKVKVLETRLSATREGDKNFKDAILNDIKTIFNTIQKLWEAIEAEDRSCNTMAKRMDAKELEWNRRYNEMTSEITDLRERVLSLEYTRERSQRPSEPPPKNPYPIYKKEQARPVDDYHNGSSVCRPNHMDAPDGSNPCNPNYDNPMMTRGGDDSRLI